MGKIPVALQMYTVRDDAEKDFTGTLRQVAAMGYNGVELAGTGGLSAVDLRRLLDGFGLQIAGSHVGLNLLESDLDSQLDYYTALGAKHITCPWLPEERRKTADDWRRLAITLTEAGQRTKQRGIQLCYHNHAFEFQRFDGQTGFDILFGAADPDLVKVEMDTYWVEYGGESAAAYLRSYAGRVPLVHLKDMASDEKRSFAEVGHGTMDWNAIFAAAESVPGVDWYIVEQDTCPRPPLESARMSLEWLGTQAK